MSAENVRTSNIHAASELRFNAELRVARWKCVGCSATMDPVAVAPDKKFEVIAYFRINGNHDEGCPAQDETRLVHPSRKLSRSQCQALAAAIPTRLRLVHQSPEVETGPDLDASGLQARLPRSQHTPGSAAPASNAERTVTGLALIARHYAFLPEERSRPLHVPGVRGTTYDECIQRLGSHEAPLDGQAPRLRHSILHAPVSFKAGVPSEGDIEIGLFCGRLSRDIGGKISLARRYAVRFEQHGWPREQIDAMRKTAEAWVVEQRRLGRDADVEIHLFFLGSQSQDGFTFVVPDWRLACFQSVLRRR